VAFVTADCLSVCLSVCLQLLCPPIDSRTSTATTSNGWPIGRLDALQHAPMRRTLHHTTGGRVKWFSVIYLRIPSFNLFSRHRSLRKRASGLRICGTEDWEQRKAKERLAQCNREHGAWSMVHGAWIMEMAIVGLSPAKWKERATPTPWKEGVIKAIIKNYKLCPINWHLIVEIYTELTVARKKVGGGVSRHTKLSQAVQVGLPHPHQRPDSHPYVCISTRRWNAGEDQTIPIWWSRCRRQSAAIYDASL